jgi:hypothetical protein
LSATVAEDFGAAGPAAARRPSLKIEVEGVAKGSASPGDVVTVLRYLDTALHDRMYACGQLSTRQRATAARVARMHEEAGFEPRTSASYAPRGWLHGHNDDDQEAEAVIEFRRLLGGCSEVHAWLLHGLCLGQHPGTWRLTTLQAALDDLARQWGIEG